MHRIRLRFLSLLLPLPLAAGCIIDAPHYTMIDDDADANPSAIDASVPDSAPPDAQSCTPSTIVCDDATSHYVDCDANGAVAFEMDCPLGCDQDVEKCLDVVPSNNLTTELDAAATGPEVTFTGSSTIDTDDGAVNNGGTGETWHGTLVNGMRVYSLRSLTVEGTLTVTGAYPIVFLVDGAVVIHGTIDVSANSQNSGPGAVVAGSCLGVGTGSADPQGGGGGGGRYSGGARGGDGGTGNNGGTGGLGLNEPTVVPLRGGCAGGTSTTGTPKALGGGGGGAIQIVSRASITLENTGVIDASGGGGRFSNFAATRLGGGGGGSGGAVLLEAPQVYLNGAQVVISTKGGSGAAPGLPGDAATVAGSDGGTNAGPAPGGVLASYPTGGNGGTGAAGPTSGGAGTTATMDGAGGGGDFGTARFNTLSGSIAPQGGAAIRSASSAGTIGSRQVP